MLTETELTTALTEAKKAQINSILSCSTSFASNEKNLELAQKYLQIKPAVGLYPLDALELNELELDKAFYFFEGKIKNASAIGEVGLDFKYSKKTEEQKKQEQIFRKFISLSKKYSKPLIIHSRFAQKRALEILEEEKAEKVIMHSFCESLKLMEKARTLNYFVSCGPAILSNEQMQKNISLFGTQNLVFETDSPMRFDKEKVFPQKIAEIAEKVSSLTKTPLSEIHSLQEKAFNALFK